MQKISFSLLLIMLFVPDMAKATEGYDFISAIIDSFQITNIARHRYNAVDFENIDTTEQMMAITVFKKELEEASQYIEPFTKSKNSDIKLVAQVYGLTYSNLMKNGERILDLYENTLNNKNTKAGTLSRQIAEIMGEIDSLWREFFKTTGYMTNILVMSKGDSDKLTHLIFTSQEKKMILEALVRVFGNDVKVFPKEGKHSIDGSAALLYNFLDKSGFKPSDVK